MLRPDRLHHHKALGKGLPRNMVDLKALPAAASRPPPRAPSQGPSLPPALSTSSCPGGFLTRDPGEGVADTGSTVASGSFR